MRTHRGTTLRRLLALAVLAAAAFGSSAAGAVVAPQVVDALGDANGVNSWGNPLLSGRGVDAYTPAGGKQPADDLDLASVRFSTELDAKKRPVNLLAAVTLAATPLTDDVSRRYDVFFKVGTCQAVQHLAWNLSAPSTDPSVPVATPNHAAGPYFTNSVVFERGSCDLLGPGTFSLGASRIAGRTLTFRVPLTLVGGTGTVLSSFSAESHTRGSLLAVNSTNVGADTWAWDFASSPKTYRIGS